MTKNEAIVTNIFISLGETSYDDEYDYDEDDDYDEYDEEETEGNFQKII